MTTGRSSGAHANPIAPGHFAPHQQRVAANFAWGSIAWGVALYHDHLEDGLGEVPGPYAFHVEVLTRRLNETYYEYVRRIRESGDRVAIAVKRADLFDNIARCHGEHGGTKLPARALRYMRGMELLEGLRGE